MTKKPNKKEIERFVKDNVFKWFLERLALELNTIDTVRNIDPNNLNEVLARRMAIEIIENALAEIYEAGELFRLQHKLVKEEDNIIKRLQDLKTEY